MKATRHDSYKTWDTYEYVTLETPEATEGWGAKEHERHKARAAQKSLRQNTGVAW